MGPSTNRRILVTGAGGFIGHHLVKDLKRQGHWVRGADIKNPEFEETQADEFEILDLRQAAACRGASRDVDTVFALAADMGGMGFLAHHHSRIFYNNSLMNLHTIEAARLNGVERYLFSSSACVYPEFLQEETGVKPLRECDAYPAKPQDSYGWEKLMAEQVALHYRDDHGLDMRIARFHNIFGPLGTWNGGREKVPAALCRKIATAKFSGEHEIEIWGDGEQTRSFCYIDDCVEGLRLLMESGYAEPINLGQDRMISINALADLIADIAGVPITKRHVPGPMGVRGRNSDNSLLQQTLDWQPQVSLEEGLTRTYRWIENQVRAQSTSERFGATRQAAPAGSA